MSDALRHWTPPSWINSHLARVGGIGGALVSGILTSTSFPGYMNIIHLFSWGVWFVSLIFVQLVVLEGLESPSTPPSWLGLPSSSTSPDQYSGRYNLYCSLFIS